MKYFAGLWLALFSFNVFRICASAVMWYGDEISGGVLVAAVLLHAALGIWAFGKMLEMFKRFWNAK